MLKKYDLKKVTMHLQQAENNLSHIKHNKDALMKAYDKLAQTYETIGLIAMAYSRNKMYT